MTLVIIVYKCGNHAVVIILHYISLPATSKMSGGLQSNAPKMLSTTEASVPVIDGMTLFIIVPILSILGVVVLGAVLHFTCKLCNLIDSVYNSKKQHRPRNDSQSSTITLISEASAPSTEDLEDGSVLSAWTDVRSNYRKPMLERNRRPSSNSTSAKASQEEKTAKPPPSYYDVINETAGVHR